MARELTAYSTGSLLVQAQKRLHLQPEWHLRPAFTHLQLVHLPFLPQPAGGRAGRCRELEQGRWWTFLDVTIFNAKIDGFFKSEPTVSVVAGAHPTLWLLIAFVAAVKLSRDDVKSNCRPPVTAVIMLFFIPTSRAVITPQSAFAAQCILDY